MSLIYEDIDSYFNSGLEETGVLNTTSGNHSIDGIYFDNEDVEAFMEMEMETDDEIFFVKKSKLPGDQKKDDTLTLTGRNGGSAYIIKRFSEIKDSTDIITAIYLSKD